MFNRTRPTRQASTNAQYLRRYHQLKARFSREMAVDDMTSDEVTAHLLCLKPTLAMSSWRLYKAATLYYLDTHDGSEAAIEVLWKESSAGLPRRSTKTSGPKLKQVPTRIWSAFQKGLDDRARAGHRHAAGLRDILAATLLCGLRPNEWSFSAISTHAATGRAILTVRNSKHSNGRANGEYREMFIDLLSQEERATIDRALAYCHADSAESARKRQGCIAQELLQLKSQLLANPRFAKDDELSRVTQYSFRHQFIADAKCTFSDPVVTSALVGHSSTKTAFSHYGRRAHGTTTVRVMPTQESLEAVHRRHLEIYNDFVAHQTSRPQLD